MTMNKKAKLNMKEKNNSMWLLILTMKNNNQNLWDRY